MSFALSPCSPMAIPETRSIQFAEIWHARKIGRPIEGGLNTLAGCRSADVRDPFLGLRLGCGSGLCRKLEHCCFLTFKHVSQEHDLRRLEIPAHHGVYAGRPC